MCDRLQLPYPQVFWITEEGICGLRWEKVNLIVARITSLLGVRQRLDSGLYWVLVSDQGHNWSQDAWSLEGEVTKLESAEREGDKFVEAAVYRANQILISEIADGKIVNPWESGESDRLNGWLRHFFLYWAKRRTQWLETLTKFSPQWRHSTRKILEDA